MSWPVSPRVHLRNPRIDPADAERQTRTVEAILERFHTQPGVILADEVGMGKTYVALAVAASVVEAIDGAHPVVIMVPSSVQRKWPREWEVFQELCLGRGRPIRSGVATRGSDFLKLLDDPVSRRNDIIFITHGALNLGLADPLIRLAILRQALRHPSLGPQRAAFPRWGERMLPNYRPFRDAGFVRILLDTRLDRWRSAHRAAGHADPGDDPIPAHVRRVLPRLDLSSLETALAALPLRTSTGLESRLAQVRATVRGILPATWSACLRATELELPLLILDEAHHVKNPGTRLAGLFASPPDRTAAEALRGPLAGVFDRMLFMTATPFQLGHSELIEVLSRFDGVRWEDTDARRAFRDERRRLASALDHAQTEALRLDQAWGRLRSDDVQGLGDSWWSSGSVKLPMAVQDALRRARSVEKAMRDAEKLLRPWVIRHARPGRETRRTTVVGRGVSPSRPETDRSGLEVTGRGVLPFLLAARTQAMVATEAHLANERTRAFFADGLASSFEAYSETRRRSGARADADDVDGEVAAMVSAEASWYLERLDAAIPRGIAARSHPKIEATVERVVDRWTDGHKVLVFCFYVATGRALREHISRALLDWHVFQAKRQLDAGSRAEALATLERMGDTFFDPKRPATRLARRRLRELFTVRNLSQGERDTCVAVALRFLRTPSFLLRDLRVGEADLERQLDHQLAVSGNGNGLVGDRLRAFATFVASRVGSERAELLAALTSIQTGDIRASADTLDVSERAGRRATVLPSVRLANGGVRQETRQRLMLAFNSPFFPEVLVASAVMAEGVDLHLHCRHVLHHDLDWNPSVLEQRTGRVDRLGSEAERSGRPIVVYEPFVAGTQDEKQFRVVSDRERWFNVVMGEALELDEWSTDRLSERVALPMPIAERLAFRLQVGHS